MDWGKEITEEYKDDNENWVGGEGALKLNFYTHDRKVNDDIVNKVIAGMDKPQCDNVRYINLYYCKQITDAALTTIGEHCRHLTKIELHSNFEVTDEGIAAVLGNNPKITDLSFTNCEKATSASIDAVIKYCPDIETLHAYDHVGLTSLPENIGTLSKLKELYLRDNNITTLPLSIGNLPQDCKLNFYENPIKNVPPSVLQTENNGQAILRFFSAALKGAAKSNQFKIVLLGTGEAGKTSLLNALIGQRKPLTTKMQRTIHVEIREFQMQRENGLPSIKIKAYNFGGQETYALGQSQYYDENGIYVVVINADEEDSLAFIAHVKRLRANSPNAVVIVVLSKADILKSPETIKEKVRSIQNAVKQFNDDAANNTDTATNTDTVSSWRPIPTDVIVISVKKKASEAKRKILDAIQTLIVKEASLFPSIGMTLPQSWLECMEFTDVLCVHGSDNHKGIDDRMKVYYSKEEKKAKKLNKEAERAATGSSSLLERAIGAIPRIKTKSSSKNLRHILTMKKNQGYEDSASKGIPKYNGVRCPYIRKDGLIEAWKDYHERKGGEKDTDILATLDDCIDLCKAQGGLITSGDLIILEPTFVAAVMKTLTDHTLSIEVLQSHEFKKYISKSIPPDEYGILTESLTKFIRVGELHMNVVKYLFRLLPIKGEDINLVLGMLIEEGTVFWSKSLNMKKGQTSVGEASGDVLGQYQSLVLFRLSPKTDIAKVREQWPEPCPSGKHHFEVRFEFPFGCLPSLAAHFAASAHSFGLCLYADIHSAIILVEENRSLMYVKLVRDDNDKESLSVAFRSRSAKLDHTDQFYVWRMVNFLKTEKEQKYPRLIYETRVVCPSCCLNGKETSCPWDPTSSAHICEICHEDINILDMFGKDPGLVTNPRIDSNGCNPPSSETTSAEDLVEYIRQNGAPTEKPLVMISARFKGDKYEEMVRELASELKKAGVNAYIVGVGSGMTFGNKTLFGLHNMVVMVCFCTPHYGERTVAVYSSFGELKYASENHIDILPIKMCEDKDYPPSPNRDFDGQNFGPAQNKFVFSADLVYNDWSQRDWDAVKCAEETKVALEKMGKCPMIEQSSSVSPSFHPQSSTESNQESVLKDPKGIEMERDGVCEVISDPNLSDLKKELQMLEESDDILAKEINNCAAAVARY